MNKSTAKLDDKNFLVTVLTFQDRQAGVSVIYDAQKDRFTYNAYCLEKKLLKDLFACEYEYLSDALELINNEFGSWTVTKLEEDKGCGTCVAK